MAKALSADLRERIVQAVESEGMSRRAAAGRFGVVPSTAVELVSAWRSTGSLRPRPQGGDRRSMRIEAHAAKILALVEETPDITLKEIGEILLQDCKEHFASSVISRFFGRRDITFKKNRARKRTGAP